MGMSEATAATKFGHDCAQTSHDYVEFGHDCDEIGHACDEIGDGCGERLARREADRAAAEDSLRGRDLGLGAPLARARPK